jgi:uncharacterized protein involved in exopolysaccharide biosynthesis
MTSLGKVPEPPSESADLFDYAALRHVLGFVFRGAGRHRALSGLVFAATLGLGAVVLSVLPRTYHVEAKLLASRSELIRSLGNPRTAGTPAEDPTRASEETVFARDNLLALIQQNKLLEKAEQQRTLLSRLHEWVLVQLFGPLTDADRLDAMVGLLEKRMRVVTDSQTVVIGIDWPDPQGAYQLIESAQQNFLEARHVAEMTSISEALSILQTHAQAEQEHVTQALLELERVRELRRQGLSSLSPEFSEAPAPPQPAPQAPQPRAEVATPGVGFNDPELDQLKFLYHQKRRALDDLEEFRAKRLVELNSQLAEQRVQYADKHPVILETVQRIDAMTEASPQMLQLRADLAELVAEFHRKGGQNLDALVEPARRAAPSRSARPAGPEPVAKLDLSEDPEVEFARNTLRVASATAEELKLRIDSARIEQDTARAAFKYRYSVIRPASLPRKPLSPDFERLALATLALALLFGLLAGACLEWWRGTLAEAWQVEAQLGLPVLSEVKEKGP